MMKKILLILPILLLVSCEEDTPDYIDGDTEMIGNNREVIYWKDSRTGFCFAERGRGNHYSFTCVPCTEEVEALIENTIILKDK